jgi:hypothetical protein
LRAVTVTGGGEIIRPFEGLSMEGIMKLYAGLDVSQATTAICIIRENGERAGRARR